MKLRIPRTILVAAAALVFGSAVYAQEINVRIRVPFDFVVGDKMYPAGEYAVQTAKANTYYLSIKNEDKTTRELIDSYPCISSKPLTPGNQAKLVFHRVENTYFLHRVWVGGSTVGREFPKSHREAQMAMNGSTTETTIVAANIAR
jgi:hypothetical protein